MHCEVKAKNLMTGEVILARNANELVRKIGTSAKINVTRYIQCKYLLEGKWALDYTGFVYPPGKDDKLPKGAYIVERALKNYFEYTVQMFKDLKEDAQLATEDELVENGISLEDIQVFYDYHGLEHLKIK